MNDLIEIYRRIEYLRNNGLKMKEIADYVDMAPSVLSALYSSVLPTYVTSFIIRKSKFPQNPKRSVRFSGKGTKRSVQKRKARNTQKAETKVL